MTEDEKQNLGERLTRSIKIDKNGCWIWQLTVNHDGYGVTNYAKRKYISTSRASWLVFKGPIAKGLHVLHRCDVRRCLNPFHLFLGTPGENAKDRDLKARHPKHIPEETVIAIQKLDTCWSFKAIASTYGISQETVKRIVTRSRPRYRDIYKAHQAGAKDE